MSLVDLLCDEEDKKNTILTVDYALDDQTIINHIDNSSIETKRRIISYFEQWILKSSIDLPTGNVSIITDAEGKAVKEYQRPRHK